MNYDLTNEPINMLINERNKDLLEINESLKQLTEIQNDLGLMIHNQNDNINLINKNLENSDVNIQESNINLQKTLEYSKKTGIVTVTGGIMGGCIGGPVGSIIGLKLSGIVLLSASCILAGGGIGYLSQL